MHQAASHVGIKVETGLDDVGMRRATVRLERARGASLEKEGESEVIGRKALAEHGTEDAEGTERAVAASDEGIPLENGGGSGALRGEGLATGGVRVGCDGGVGGGEGCAEPGGRSSELSESSSHGNSFLRKRGPI